MTPAERLRVPHVLMVFTGGTISSRISGSTFEISDPPYQLLEDVSEDRMVFTICEPFSTLSENMTPDMLFRLFCAISEACSAKIYDGILIAHGTDTMAYTAQLAYVLLSGLGLPVVLFGSKLPLENPENDGTNNFKNAIALLKQTKTGVFVVSRSRDGTNYVHSAGKIMQATSENDDFLSCKGQYAGILQDGKFQRNPKYPPTDPPARSLEYLRRISSLRVLPTPETVLVLDACVGTHFQSFDLARKEYVFILQRLYHSGTACTSPPDSPYSLLYLQLLCKHNFKRLFIAQIDRDRMPYSTTQELIHAGITPIFDIAFEAVWAGLLLSTWLKEKPEEFFDSPG